MATKLERIVDDNLAFAYRGVGYSETRVIEHYSGRAFEVIYNPSRDFRPAQPVARSTRPQIPQKPENPDMCALCTNILKKGRPFHDIERYVVAPNDWPINRNHGLLLLNTECPDAARQGKLYPYDVEEAMKFSEESRYHVIYNTFGAAATQHHQHFQIFKGETPLSKLKMHPLEWNGASLFMPDYPGANFIYYGKNKIPRALERIDQIKRLGEEFTYTLLIRDELLTVIPRCVEGETAERTKKRIGGLECNKTFVVGDVAEKGDGWKIMNALMYEDLENSLHSAFVRWELFRDTYKSHINNPGW